jgi:hypothetical protein
MRLILFLILRLSVRCNSCQHLDIDCISPFDSFQFTYVDSDGNNLLRGITPKYEIEDIEVYSFNSSNTNVFANLQPYNGDPSVIEAQLNYSTVRSILKIGGVVRDTLDFTFKIRKTECCGEVSEIATTMLNGIAYSGSFPIEIVERN